MGSLTPLSLASRCGSVDPLLPPREVSDGAGPLGEYDGNDGISTPQRKWVSSLRPQSQHLSDEHHDVDNYDDDHEPTKLTMRQRRADEAYSDNLCQQMAKHHAINRMGRVTRSLSGRIEIP